MTNALFYLIVAALCDGDPAQRFGIAASVGREDSAVKVLNEDGAAVLDVTSKFGIDTANVKRSGDKWPDKIVVRLHLGGLESFRATAGKTTIEWSASVDGAARVSLLSDGEETAIEKESSYFSQVRVVGGDGKTPLKDGYFAVPLPARLLEGNPKQLTLRWIDFYRG